MAAPVPSGGGGQRTMLTDALVWLFALWIFWFISGGPFRTEEAKKPFLKPPSPLNTGVVYGELPELQTPSFDLKKDIRVGSGVDYSSASLSASTDEETGQGVIEIKALSNSKKPLNISGWMVKGVVDKEPRVIGGGAGTFYQGKLNTESDIVLYPGERALILAGESPVGASFMVNKCSGYLAQFQSFAPGFSSICPHIGLDNPTATSDETCGQFVRSISRCNAFVGAYPSNISSACRNLVETNLTYNSCVKNHINDLDFYRAEWRVYLGGEDTFGSEKGDIITIYDSEGNKIDSIFSN